MQGSIGDCYFLSSMAAILKRHPRLILSLFAILYNKEQSYSVNLFIEGKWQPQFLDSYFRW
jgi:hypothetical protein